MSENNNDFIEKGEVLDVEVEERDGKIFFKYPETDTLATCSIINWKNYDPNKNTLYIERIESKKRNAGGMKNVLQGIYKYFLEKGHNSLNIDAIATDDVSSHLLKKIAKSQGFRFGGYEGSMNPELVSEKFQHNIKLVLKEEK